MLIHEIFEARVRQAPERVAIHDQEATTTYGALNGRANRLARHLRARGVGPDAIVAICLERGTDLVVAILAVLKAGGACLALDPAYPTERLAFMLRDARAACLVTDAGGAERFPNLSGAAAEGRWPVSDGASIPGIVRLDSDAAALARELADDPAYPVHPDDLSFVFYTSGSTGRPKAVMWVHGDRTAQVTWERETFRLTERDPHLLKAAIGVTLLAAEILLPLLSGARLIVVPPGQESDPGQLLALIRRHGVTIITLVPTMLRALVEHPDFADCTSLREVCSFGEALTASLREQLFRRSAAVLTVVYGTTEAPGSTFAQCARDRALSPTAMGAARPGKAIYLVDERLDRVGPGEQGEICIAGGLARGYLGAPELTAEKFVPDPFSGVPGSRMYRTGDYGRYLPDGTIEFVGRADHQLKIRGFRVEAGDIERALCEHPAVLQAAVTARDDRFGEARLVACLAAQPGQALSDRGLRRHLKDRLPGHMIPTVFVMLDALPTLPGGKLDRPALADLAGARLASDHSGVAPRNAIEQTLATIWADVLDVPAVGVLDDFFDVGGDSLAAIRVIGRVVQTFGQALSLQALFDAPTVAAMAQVIAQAADRAGGDPVAS